MAMGIGGKVEELEPQNLRLVGTDRLPEELQRQDNASGQAQGRGIEPGPTEVGHPRGSGESVVQPATVYLPEKRGGRSRDRHVFFASYLTDILLRTLASSLRSAEHR
jgi:hypothetical protein